MSVPEGRIPITHVGSLPRPHDLLDMMKARLTGEGDKPDETFYRQRVTEAVAEIVARQAECGIDIVTDGEMSKAGFFAYAEQRLSGLERRPDAKYEIYTAEREAFPEYYEAYMARAMLGGNVAKVVPLYCVGPLEYAGKDEELDRTIWLTCAPPWTPRTAPAPSCRRRRQAASAGTTITNTEEEFFFAIGDAMRTEYQAIVDAGFYLQVDDPFLSDIFGDKKLDDKQRVRKADMYVESINHALSGLPVDRIRFHTCYGINEGPRIFEPQLGDVIGHMLRIDASVYSFEAANPRHEHDYHVFESVTLPEGRKIMPGMITHASNIVEHPELIAEWLVRFAGLVGRENLLAGADCGFSSQACYHTEVHPTVIWAKFRALAEGARLASEKLW